MERAKELIRYIESLGLTVNTTTKARGHRGFFLDNRIDISKFIPKDRVVPTLLHEFAHYIHSKIESNVAKTGGSLKKIFNTEEDLFEELILITNFIDEHSTCRTLLKHKSIVKEKIKNNTELIKNDYPNFKRSEKFKVLEKLIIKSKAKYLLKYDSVRIMGWFFKKEEIYSVKNLEVDFPELKPACIAYIRLKSYQRKQKRITARINKIKKYYERPTELFARFVEALYVNPEETVKLAPKTTNIFYKLLESGYYNELNTAINIVTNYKEQISAIK